MNVTLKLNLFDHLLIQFEKATCSSFLTVCVVPSADIADMPA